MTFESLENLNGQLAVVTGANGGIGRAIATTLARRGAQVVGVTWRNLDDLAEFMSTLPGTGHQAKLADVRNSDELIALASDLSRCDILVNSAGFSKPIPHKKLDALSDEFFDEMLIMNCRAVFSTVRAFESLLTQSKHALIVNISSASALKPGHGSNIAYVAAKAGVESMTKNLALVLAPVVRVVSICPSSVNTGFLTHGQEFYDRAGEATPLKRIAVPEDVAAVVESVALTMRYATGDCFVVDGGRIL
jgi:NAD(P)-dependent dehydrogenase (short-subunit alcohol dehydrogenase family)